MKRHPIPLDRKIIQFLLVCAMALSTVPATPVDASPPSTASEADTALAALTPFLANADDPNTVVLSAVGQIAPAMVQARIGQTVTFANIDTVTRTLRLDGTPVDGSPNRAWLPIVVRGGAAMAAPVAPARPSAPVDVRNISIPAGQSRVFTFTRAGNVTVTDIGFPGISASVLVIPAPLASEGAARGIVRSYATKLGIPGAHVKTLDGAFETIADASGRYTLTLPAGEFTLAMFANGFTFANRKARVEAFAPTQIEAVYLVPQDGVVAPIGAAGGSVINSTGETSATFAGGAVSTTKAIRLTVLPTDEFADGGDFAALPGPFTEGDIPLAFVMFEPDGTHFDGRVNWQNIYTGSLPIGTNWTNGLYCDYWLEAEARWGEPEPAEVIAGPGGTKILSTTLPHFSAYGYRIGPPPTAGGMPITLTAVPGSAAGPDTNRPKDNPKCPNGKCPKGSGVNLLDGELTQEIETLALPSAGGAATAVGATYHSRDAGAPGATVSVTLPVALYTLPPDRAEWEFDIAGRVFTGTGRNVNLRWDGRDANGALMPPGRQEGRLTSIYKFNSPTGWSNFTSVMSWPVQLSRPDFSPWGLGWFGAHDTLLIDRGLAATIQQADGRQLNFVKTGAGYTSPNSDFSTLTRGGDGAWTRSFRDGSTMRFNIDGRLERVTDRFGNYQAWYYEANGVAPLNGAWALTTRIRRVQDTSGNTFDYAYTPAGWLSTITDSAGRVYALSHDAAGNLTSITYPDGNAESYGYDGRNLMTSHTDARGNQTLYGLDDEGQILTRTWPTGSQLQVSRVTTRTVVTLDSGAKITTVLDGRYNPAASQNGVYSVTYSASPRNQTNNASNSPGLTLYDANGNVIAAYDAAVTLLERGGPYDQVSAITRSDGNNAQVGFDALGNVSVITNALGYTTRFTTNAQGLRASAQDALGNTVTNAYSARGQLTRTVDPLGNAVTITYTPYGGVQSLADPLGNVTRQEQDALQRTTAITDALSGVTRLTYDPQGNPTRMTDPSGRVLSRTFDVLNRPIAVYYPDGGIERFGYDADGALAVYTDTRGVRTDFVTDAANRLVGSNVQGGRRVTSTYDAQDQLVGVSDGAISSTMTFLAGESGFLTRVKRTPLTGLPLTSTLDVDYGQADDPMPPAVVTPLVYTPVALPVLTPTLNALTSLSATMPVVNVCGTISSDTVFTGGNVYRVTCNLTVNAGVTLTIQPGTVVKLNNTSITVDGALIADGSASQPIALTSVKDDSVGGDTNGDGGASQPAAGDWYYVNARNDGMARFAYTTLRYGGGGCFPCALVLSQNTARVSIANSVLFSGNSYGVYVDRGSLDLRDSTLMSNAQQSLWVQGMQAGQAITVEANTFVNNLSGGAGRIYWNAAPASVVISGNVGSGARSVFELQAPSPIQLPLTWNNPGLTLRINDVTIGVTGALTVSAGSVVKLQTAGLIVDGSFVADGAADAPIFITSLKDDTVGGDTNGDGNASQPAAGDWYNMRARNSGSIRISHATVRYGGGNPPAALVSSEDTARVSIVDSALSNSSAYGVYVDRGSLDLRSSTLMSTGQSSLYIYRMQASQRITVEDNAILNNSIYVAMFAQWDTSPASISIRRNVAAGKRPGLQLLGYLAPMQFSMAWDNPGLTLLLDQVTIGVSGSLTVGAGSLVKIAYGYDLKVDGRFIAEGSAAAPVFITSVRDDTVGGDTNGDGSATQPAAGDWASLLARNTGSMRLSHATIRYGGQYTYQALVAAINAARVAIVDSTLSSSVNRGVSVDDSASVEVSQTNFLGSFIDALYTRSFVPVTATLNYWGAANGPRHTSNPAGTGAQVTSILLPPTYRTGDVALVPFVGSRLLPDGGRARSARFASGPAYSQTLRYSYDVLGRLARQQNTGYGDYTLDLGYDPINRLTSRAVRGAATLDLSYGFDAASRVISLTAAGAAGALLSESYGYDANGNLTGTISSRDGVDSMSYDALSRISSFNGVNYAYDAAGNRTQAGAVTFGYDAGGRVSSASDGTTYAYDAAGNLASKTTVSGTTSYAWDAEGHLARVDYPDASYSQYGYDEQGRRISKRAPDGVTIYFVYARDMLMQELDAGGNVLAAYSYNGLDKPVTMWRGGQTYAYVRNALGSVLGLVDASGAWVATYRYDAWGNVISSTETVSNSLRFTAREWDAESGLYFYRARYYDPALGRFISRDPIGAKGGVNQYAYVGNRPLSARDPSGLTFCNMFGCFRWLWEKDPAAQQPEPKAESHVSKTRAAKPELAKPTLDPNAPCPFAPRGGKLITNDGGSLITNDGGSIVAQGGGNIVAQGAGNIISTNGGGIVAQGAGNIISTNGGGIVAQGAGNIISTNGGGIVAQGAGNIVAQGAGNIVAQGGGNIISTNGGGIVAQGAGN